jgi:hypothetical protein
LLAVIEGVGEAVIRAAPERIIAFVTDLEQYKRADLKIGRVLEVRRDGDRVFMRHDGKLRGLAGPPVSLELTIEAPSRVRYHSLPSLASRVFVAFEGGFELSPTAEGTRVVHTERFRFFAPWRWVVEPYLRKWLAADVPAEMARMKAILEAEA